MFHEHSKFGAILLTYRQTDQQADKGKCKTFMTDATNGSYAKKFLMEKNEPPVASLLLKMAKMQQ